MPDAPQPPPPTQPPCLCADDAAALDALVSAGLDAGRVEGGPGGRAPRLAALLSLLNAPADPDPALVDATVLRVRRAAAARAGRAEAHLHAADELALESWVMCGFDAARVPSALRARADRHAALASLVVGVPAGTMDGLVERTLARVQDGLDAQRRRLTLEPPVRRGLSLRLADLVSVAAVLLIGASVVWPVAAGVREQGRRLACNAHLGNLAAAFGQYAADHDASLPAVARSLEGSRYWNVGDPLGRSNSANLYHLARTGYTSVGALACPGNPAAMTEPAAPDAIDWPSSERVSYSYQNMFGERPTAVGPGGRGMGAPAVTVVLSDRSPVIVRTLRGEWIDPFENSLNHAGKGQHVLFGDGSARWMKRPELPGGDVIWLPRPIEQVIRSLLPRQPSMLQGTETPGDGADAFVVP